MNDTVYIVSSIDDNYAMACGCPVVTTRAVPFVSHLENAWVAPVDDADHLARGGVTYLTGHGDERKKICEGGFKTAARFCGAGQKEKLKEYLERLREKAGQEYE